MASGAKLVRRTTRRNTIRRRQLEQVRPTRLFDALSAEARRQYEAALEKQRELETELQGLGETLEKMKGGDRSSGEGLKFISKPEETSSSERGEPRLPP